MLTRKTITIKFIKVMKTEQRVYIKGNRYRGDEVIKLLTDLGGKNDDFQYSGKNEDAIYFIDPEGDIAWTSDSNTSMILPYIKEFYKEIKLPKWKPKYKEHFYCINWMGTVVETTWYDTQDEETCYELGNCFRTEQEAEEAVDKIKKVLNQ